MKKYKVLFHSIDLYYFDKKENKNQSINIEHFFKCLKSYLLTKKIKIQKSILNGIILPDNYYIQYIPNLRYDVFVYGHISNNSKPVIADTQEQELEVIELGEGRGQLYYSYTVRYKNYFCNKSALGVNFQHFKDSINLLSKKIIAENDLDDNVTSKYFKKNVLNQLSNFEINDNLYSKNLNLKDLILKKGYKTHNIKTNIKVNLSRLDNIGDFFKSVGGFDDELKNLEDIDNYNLSIEIKISKNPKRKYSNQLKDEKILNEKQAVLDNFFSNFAEYIESNKIELISPEENNSSKLFNLNNNNVRFVADVIEGEDPEKNDFVSYDLLNKMYSQLKKEVESGWESE
ncbi:hypothetical protein [Marinitoga sp. 1155]|uniref:hypothetical protein n=1 Tax=Marinitoga sp. 1155 TaxID=1428448 RepID=UPI000640C1A6|nr:hypothetical protein [Marinitoga sp. 1155]AMS33994.1 hypothetical protein UF09_52 [Marinitoga camini virus 2]KLO24781.1 hypothetical protein X274_02155 [Marinitoga sp. 1155]